MKYRKLRIAWSVAWGILCLLLIVLWVRSYWWADAIVYDGTPDDTLVMTAAGNIQYTRGEVPFIAGNGYREFQINDGSQDGAKPTRIFEWFDWNLEASYFAITTPMWFWVLFAAGLGTLPWLPWRFSLRTLLIGMTVAAIGLGWIVYVLRK